MSKLYVVINTKTRAVIAPKSRPYAKANEVAKNMAITRKIGTQAEEVDEAGKLVKPTPSFHQSVMEHERYGEIITRVKAGQIDLEEHLPVAIKRLSTLHGWVPKPIWKARRGVPLSYNEIGFVLTASLIV